jgi:hypothetical protein
MTTQCTHPKTGVVTTQPSGEWEEGARAPVCSQPACIDEATAWVQRVSRKPAYYVPAAQKAEVSA